MQRKKSGQPVMGRGSTSGVSWGLSTSGALSVNGGRGQDIAGGEFRCSKVHKERNQPRSRISISCVTLQLAQWVHGYRNESHVATVCVSTCLLCPQDGSRCLVALALCIICTACSLCDDASAHFIRGRDTNEGSRYVPVVACVVMPLLCSLVVRFAGACHCRK